MTRSGGFWAQRRAAVEAEAQTARDAQDRAKVEAAQADMTDAEILAELDLVDPDTLQPGDDFRGFMAKAVPEHLRRRALRTLWRSNPVLANVDMLVDYGEDFTDAAMVVENMQTTYQVGKGMLKHIQEMARQAQEADNPPPDDAPITDTGEESTAKAEPEPAEEQGVVADLPDPAPQDDEADFALPAPRRMTFHIKETA